MTAEGRLVGCRDHLSICFLAVAPDSLDEFQWEGPLQFGNQRLLLACSFDCEALEQHFAAGDEELAAAHGLYYGCPILVGAGEAVGYGIVHYEVRIGVLSG